MARVAKGGIVNRMRPQRATARRRVLQALCLLLFLLLFFRTAWPYTLPLHADTFDARSVLPPQVFLWMDPLAGIAASIAAREWLFALAVASVVVLLSMAWPRFFCSHLCPLGTLQDWVRSGKTMKARNGAGGAGSRWRNLRFIILALVLGAALAGGMLAGHLAAIPFLTRGLMFSAGFLQTGLIKSWGLVPPVTSAVLLGMIFFLLVLLAAWRMPRFYCRMLCPTGALLSLAGLIARRRRVVEACRECGECTRACAFGAATPDGATRALECAHCHECQEACPARVVRFGNTGAVQEAGTEGVFSRRLWIGSVGCGVLAGLGVRQSHAAPPLRPPGSVEESRFLRLCVRCGECFKVCPGFALQPAGLEAGLDALWTPVLKPIHAACHPDCHFCTQVCPTEAIRPLSLAEKRRFVIGIAALRTDLCLPLQGREECELCWEECRAAGYHAIEMRVRQLDVGAVPEGAVSPDELERMGSIRVPVVVAERCVGCGLCEYRCHAVHHKRRGVLPASAIVVRP